MATDVVLYRQRVALESVPIVMGTSEGARVEDSIGSIFRTYSLGSS